MKEAAQIVFRRLTAADFFNINKPKRSEARGGGQSYIDFPTSAVTSKDWRKFFAGVKELTTQSGPLWSFEVNSIGVAKSQTAEIGRRRMASYNIRAQKLGTKASNRLYAWHPRFTDFPKPVDPTKRSGISNLVIYLIRTADGEFWAGWFQRATPGQDWKVDERLRRMFTQDDGNINLDPAISFDEQNGSWPFQTVIGAVRVQPIPRELPRGPSTTPASQSTVAVDNSKSSTTPRKKVPPPYKQKSEEELIKELFADDLPSKGGEKKKQVITTVVKRNQKAVAALKALYGGKCQLTGESFVFRKSAGGLYCEAHHIIPLGEGGADSPFNLIIVSPLIHRMFHYADVSGVDLSRITDNKLEIEINGKPFTITWHEKDAEIVNNQVNAVDPPS